LLAEKFESRLLCFPGIGLTHQTLERARIRMPLATLDVEQGFNRAAGDSDTICATLQSLLSRKRYKKFIGKVKFVMVDEAHLFFTKQVNAMLDEFVEGGALIVGLTATPFSKNQGGLLSWWQKLSYAYTIQQATADGLLVPGKVVRLTCKSYDLSRFKVRGTAADFNQLELDEVLSKEGPAQEHAAAIAQYYGGECCIAFAQSIRHADMICDILRNRHGVPASIVHSQMDDDVRADEMRRFMSGETKVIVNVSVLVTGFDHPDVRKLFLCKPTASLSTYMQMYGRATRPLPGLIDNPVWTAEQRRAAIAASLKPHFTVYDIGGSSECHSLRTAIDIHAPDASPEVKRRVTERITKAGDQPVDPDPIIKEEILREARAKAAAYAAEQERRRNLIVGVTFDERSRDPFAEPTRSSPPGRRAYMPFGKHRGKPISVVDTGYLQWVVGLNKRGWVHEACLSELARRKTGMR
jgi:superfamily II DNA or RNA helicase